MPNFNQDLNEEKNWVLYGGGPNKSESFSIVMADPLDIKHLSPLVTASGTTFPDDELEETRETNRNGIQWPKTKGKRKPLGSQARRQNRRLPNRKQSNGEEVLYSNATLVG